MKTIRFHDCCDPLMLVPQPTKWAASALETIDEINNVTYDELFIGQDDGAEDLAVFLRDNPERCPKRVVLSWSLNPFIVLKIKMWLTGKVFEWNE